MNLWAVVIFFLAGVAFTGTLLVKRSIKPGGFSLILLTFFVISVVAYRIDDIVGISYKNAKIELREIKNEAYATIEAVRAVGKLSAELATDMAVRIGYIGSRFELHELNRYRRLIEVALDSMQVTSVEKERILGLITNKIRRQLAYEGVEQKVIGYMNSHNNLYSREEQARIRKELSSYFQSYKVDKTDKKILDFLDEVNIPADSTMTIGLAHFNHYLKTGELLSK